MHAHVKFLSYQHIARTRSDVLTRYRIQRGRCSRVVTVFQRRSPDRYAARKKISGERRNKRARRRRRRRRREPDAHELILHMRWYGSNTRAIVLVYFLYFPKTRFVFYKHIKNKTISMYVFNRFIYLIDLK